MAFKNNFSLYSLHLWGFIFISIGSMSSWLIWKFLGFFFFFYRLFILERGEGGRKRRKETSVCGCLSHAPTRDLAHNPGLCRDWEWNWWPFGSQAGAQATEQYQTGQFERFLFVVLFFLVLHVVTFILSNVVLTFTIWFISSKCIIWPHFFYFPS